jgi:hypothetical protein
LLGDVWAQTRADSTGSQSDHLRGVDHQRQHRAASWSPGQSEDQNGVTETELKEVVIHLAFYVGWPLAMSAIMVAKEAFAG